MAGKLDQMRALRERRASTPARLRQPEISRVSVPVISTLPTPAVENSLSDKAVKPGWPANLKAAGMSISEFADLMSIPISTAYDWSRGHTPTPGWVGQVVWLLTSKTVGPANLDALRASPRGSRHGNPF